MQTVVDEEAFEREQGDGLRRRVLGALGVAVFIHVVNLATNDGAMVGLATAIPLRGVALAACAAGLWALRRPAGRAALERRLGPVWLTQIIVLGAMQYASPTDAVYPWSGAIIFGSMLLTLACGFSPRWSAALLSVGIGLPMGVLIARLGTVSDTPVSAFVAAAVVASSRGRERLARAEFAARTELARLHEERLRAQRTGFVEELHDGPAAGIARAVSILERAVAGRDVGPDALQAARAELGRALGEARALMNDLDEPVERWDDLVAEIRREVVESCEGAGLTAVFDADVSEVPSESTPDPSLSHALRRAAREGVSNVIRHGAARTVWTRLRAERSVVDLVIEDDGRGVGDGRRGRGLSILAARVRRRGGSVEVCPRDGGGTRLRLTLPRVEQPDAPRAS